MSTTVNKLRRLIDAKHDMRIAINENGVMPWGGLTVYAEAISQIVPKDAPLVMYDGWKLEGSTFEETPVIDISNMTNLNSMFKDCVNMNVVRLIGNPSKIRSVEDMFLNCSGGGTLYYDSKYSYSKIIKALPDRWTSVRYKTVDYGFEKYI